MNSESVNPNTKFEELVESYINGSITEEQSKELLDMVRADEKLKMEFAGQLQVSELLEARDNPAATPITDMVLAMLAENAPVMHKEPKNFRWQSFLLSTAAVLAIFLGVAHIVDIQLVKHDAVHVVDVEIREPQALKELHDLDSIEECKPDALEVVCDMETPSLEVEVPAEASAPARKGLAKAKSEKERQVVSFLEANTEMRRSPSLSAKKAVADSSSIQARRLGRPMVLGGNNGPRPERPRPVPSRESYAKIEENIFLNPQEKPLSTFSIDVDTASYANLRRMVKQNQLPPADAVRLEEMINYFEYDYKGPGDEKPFSTAMAMHACPWNADHYLMRVGIQGRNMDESERKPSNLVFLLDVSGSMNSQDKLPLLKTGMKMLVRALSENDSVAIVVYAGSSGLVLDSTSAAEKGRIIDAMDRLSAGGSTAGGAGIELAYRVAQDNFIKGGVNRVILATDGDFNVGTSSHGGLQSLIEEKRKSGVFLSVLGFGTGNLQDSKMELLANKGNGNYFYIDSEREAQKVLVKQLNATLVTIAKDVKIQVEFNPEHVKSYRLIGYENRKMAARDFDDDKKDAGEIGAGHQVTALYEIVPYGAPDQHQGVPLKYGKKEENRPAPKSDEMLTLKLRYKAPDGDVSKLLEFPYTTKDLRKGDGDESFRWSAAVAAFGQILRGSQYIGKFTLRDVRKLALSAKGEDENGYRSEFIGLVERVSRLKGEESPKNDKGYPVWQYRN